MFRSSIDFELFEHGATQWVFGQHPLYRMLDDPGRMSVHHFTKAGALESTGIAGVMIVELLLCLVASNPNLFRIYDDDIVAGI